tara:strand:+ start:793 stop:2064 length:1272 start_codon:yes stop_codon:yes gene_type:complete
MFVGKKITVMGLGLLGRGVGDTKYLAQQGADLLVTDLKTEEELRSSLDQLKEFSNITYVLGEHRLEDFENKDMVLKGNGVPLDNKYINHAREHGVEAVMSGALFHELSNLKMIGITGTRGKTTVTHLIHHALENSLLGGNIRGVSNLELLDQTEGKDIAVFELDSWQLQGFGDKKISPNIAVFINFMEDHLNYYKGDMSLYFKDKANIFLYQKDGDVLIIGEEMEEKIKEYRDDYIVARRGDVDPSWHPNLIGEHNEKNVACAYHVLKTYGLTDEQIKEAFMSFKGIEGRLEDIGKVNGVQIFNDSTSTTPAATAAGIAALKGAGKIIVITGGADKELPLDGFNEVLDSADHVILLAGSGTEKLERDEKQHDSIQSAVTEAFGIAEEGDVILFSPGFASFGMFKNEYDRNDQFLACIKEARLT